VPFSSINFGLDTTPEGRLVTKMILTATEEGLGNGETPIFPVSIFTLKKGINYDLDDPNYDLFQYACKVSAKRLFPNFSSQDASCNLPYYKADDYRTWVAYMGCRTHLVANVNGEQIFTGRGNFAFATINLPKLAIESKGNLKKFYKLYDKYIDLCAEYLKFRFDIVAKRHAYNYPFLMGEGIWNDGDKLHPHDTIADVIKQSSLSVGFCGLAECLVSLIGKHHGESEEAQKLGLEIIHHLHERMDEFTAKTHLNWSAFATPAESTAGSFAKSNQEHYGKIPGITDRDYITNSFHVPVYYKISAIDKIHLEAPYHRECLAGHISYVEFDGDPTKNLKAFESVIRAMHDADMGYFSINHKVDRDPICGFTGIIQNECPHCHRLDGESAPHHIVIPKICCNN
jgi:ribonucleoside-triphosphate reductase